MSDYKLTFKLKQHTPIIHFQHNQHGATLRASELKPKLDRYLLTKFGNGDYQNGIIEAKKNKWLVGKGEHPALDYKVKLSTDSAPNKYLITSYLKTIYRNLLAVNDINFLHSMPYFAQENEISSLFEENDTGRTDRNRRRIFNYTFNSGNLKSISKWGLMYPSIIELLVYSYEDGLLNKIGENIHAFFVYENFGTRQSKGFGCFSVITPECKYNFEELLLQNFKYVYRNKSSFYSLQDMFEQIAKDYKLLKSGRGSKELGGYAKSQLFLHFVTNPNPIRWEKRKIKININTNSFKKSRQRNGSFQDIQLKVENGNSAIYNEKGNQSWNDPTNGFDYKYIRTLLGLAEQFEFQTDSSRFKYVVQLESKNEIQRFRSPIQFKVIDNQIYLVANDIDSYILSSSRAKKEFNFNLRLKENNKLSDNIFFKRPMFTLETPEQFDIGDFLKFALETGTEKINNYENVQ